MTRTLPLFLLAFPAFQALGQPAPVRFNDLLEVVRQSHRMPALAGAVVTSKGLVAQGAVGLRKAGTDVKVTVDDKWHLGSDPIPGPGTFTRTWATSSRARWPSARPMPRGRT